MAFTRTFAAYDAQHAYVREMACLRAQYPAQLGPIVPGDWFAGRNDRMLVGCDPEHGGNTEVAYYCDFTALREMLATPDLPAELRADADYLLDFWQTRQYYRNCRAAFSTSAQQGLPSDNFYEERQQAAYPFYAICGTMLDYGKLLRLGVAGLHDEVCRAEASAADEEACFVYQGMHAALTIFTDCAHWYAAQARELAAQATDAAIGDRLQWMAGNLTHIAEEAPRSYGEAVQLLWLYNIIALPRNYGRLDVVLGDFLAHDLQSGVLSNSEARAMTIGLWDLIMARGDLFNNRIVIGGLGRPNPDNANRFAMLALEVQGITNYPIPQLSLRWHTGMPPEIWEKALEVIAGGSTHPMLFNDDINVAGVEAAFGVPRVEAEQYFMYGCGEYVLDHLSVGSPQGALNVPKVLEATLHNGRNILTSEQCGLPLGTLATYATFADLQQAFMRQLAYHIANLADVAAAIYRVTGEVAAFPFLSLLYDDCIARGKALLHGGVRYLGATVESFGNITAADSLLAIKRTVYEERTLDPATLLAALEANFVGYAPVQAQLQRVAKFGNDDAEADAMALWVNTVVCELTKQQAQRVGLDSFLIVLVNNGDNVTTGRGSGASADGRQAGMPFSNANQPTAGNDHTGLTALLTSMAKLPASLHAGATQNLKLSRQTIVAHRQEVSALLRGYFAAGGTQLMITVTDRGELEDALQHPERHRNLIIRVGGYSAHFVELSQDIQLDVLARTLY